jgi:hypothetical protein
MFQYITAGGDRCRLQLRRPFIRHAISAEKADGCSLPLCVKFI